MAFITTANYPLESLQRGGLVGPYTLLEPIGRGGEAAVWSGWDNRHERVVALKMIPQAREDRDLRAWVSSSFEQQVRLLASLDHPHILPLYEFGGTNDYFYFVMRYSCTGSLTNLLAKGPIPLDQVIRLCAQITSALGYIHERGIVHRDIKPSNILLDSQERIYLSDFGLAKRLLQETAPLHTGRGTAPYVPYEQYILSNVTPQSDIFSLGILIYEMVIGKLPWGGTDSLFLRQDIQDQELPDLRNENPLLPSSLTDVLRQMTAFHWENRPPSVGEAFNMLLEAVQGYLTEESSALLEISPKVEEDALLVEDGKFLLHSTLQAWQPEEQIFPERLTHLALIDSAIKVDKDFRQSLDDSQRQFMLRGALTYGYQQVYWWQQIDDPQVRIRICLTVLMNEEDEAAQERALAYLLDETAEKAHLDEFPLNVLERLVDIAVNSQGWSLRQDALYALERLTPRMGSWQKVGLSSSCDQELAAIALGEDSQANLAARLIGRTRSETAVQTIIQAQNGTEPRRVINALAEIHAGAGSLPSLVPVGKRFQIAILHLRRQLFDAQESNALIRTLVGTLAGLLVSLTMLGGLFFIQDAQMRDILMQPYQVSNIVTIINVDDASLERFGRWADWPRSLHADLINRLRAAGPKAIVFDFVFASQTDQDKLLSEAMSQAGNVLFPVIGLGDAYLDQPGVVHFKDRVLPHPALMASTAALGHSNILHDPDGVVRRAPTTIEVEEERYPNLALAALQVFLGAGEGVPRPVEDVVAFAGRQIPVTSNGEMVIHFAGPPAQPGASTYHTVSYGDAIDGKVPPDLFKDKIVLVGMASAAEPDRYLTPVSEGRPMYGIEILANTIETIWSQRFIYQPSQFLSIVSLIILGALTGLVCKRPWAGLFFAIGIAALYFLLVTWLFDALGLALGLFFPFLTIALSFVMVTTYNYSIETRHRRRIMRMFEKRVTPETARATVRAVQRGVVNLEGQVKDVSLLISELRGYTTHANLYGPQAAIDMVERYWEIVTQASLESEGTTVHREGEQALALFNAPLPQPDHAWRAVKTAFNIRAQVTAYHQTLEEDHPHRKVDLSYGIYTGKAIVGYVDHAHSQDYTVMGNAVNIAARLASAARPGQILVNDGAYEKTSQNIVTESLPPLSMRDQANPIQVYEVLQTRQD